MNEYKKKDKLSIKKNKSNDLISKKYKMTGAGDVIGASMNMINSMKDLGKSIFDEIRSIQNIPQDINNVASVKAVPNNNLQVPK